MSASVELLGPRDGWAPPPAKLFDEAVWQVWVIKGRAQERQASAARMKAVKWLSIAGLLAMAVVFGTPALLYSPVTPAFSSSGGWQRALVVATAAPIVASLAWRDSRPAHK